MKEISILRNTLKEWLATFYAIRAAVNPIKGTYEESIWTSQQQAMARGFIQGKCDTAIFTAKEMTTADDIALSDGGRTERNALTLRNLRKLMGFVENGTSQSVEMFQDATTMEFTVRVNGKWSITSISLIDAINTATEINKYE